MHYGDVFPPIYNLSNIPHDLPLFISYGGRDALSDARDVQNLLDNLKFHDVDKLSVQFIKEYAHADYVMGFNAKDFVYNAVISFFNHQVNTWCQANYVIERTTWLHTLVITEINQKLSSED